MADFVDIIESYRALAEYTPRGLAPDDGEGLPQVLRGRMMRSLKVREALVVFYRDALAPWYMFLGKHVDADKAKRESQRQVEQHRQVAFMLDSMKRSGFVSRAVNRVYNNAHGDLEWAQRQVKTLGKGGFASWARDNAPQALRALKAL